MTRVGFKNRKSLTEFMLTSENGGKAAFGLPLPCYWPPRPKRMLGEVPGGVPPGPRFEMEAYFVC